MNSMVSRSGARAWLFLLTLAVMAAAPRAAEEKHSVPANVAAAPAPVQPLPFSHKTHVAAGLACQMCHSNPDPGVLMTYPATGFCMSCHGAIATDKPSIIRLREYSESGDPVPWVRVYEVTPGVTWSHRAHLDAGAQCQTCHGDVGQRDAVAETTAVLAMSACIGCHEAHGAPAECVSCHAWPTDEHLGIGN